jgi:hypothetical protein
MRPAKCAQRGFGMWKSRVWHEDQIDVK